jgi:hypothetical protein
MHLSVWYMYCIEDRFIALFVIDISTRKVAQHKGKAMPISCIHQSCWYFRPSFVICTLPVPPSLPSLWLPSPPFSVSKYSIYRHCVFGRGWGWWVTCWRPFSAKSFTLCIRSYSKLQNLQNCYSTPRQNPRRRGGLLQKNTCSKVPFPAHIFLDENILHCVSSV